MVNLVGVVLDILGLFFGDWIRARSSLHMIAIAVVIAYYSYKLYRLV